MNTLKNLEQENRGEPIRDSVGRVLARKASGIHNDQGCQVHLLQATLGLFFFEAANKHWQLRVAVLWTCFVGVCFFGFAPTSPFSSVSSV